MRMLVYFAFTGIHLMLALTTAFALLYGTLYLVRCVNIARRHGA